MLKLKQRVINDSDEIIHVPLEHAEYVQEIVAQAFFNDPFMIFLFPSESHRMEEMKVFCSVMVAHAFKNGEIVAIKSQTSKSRNPYAAVSLWYHGTKAFGSIWSYIRVGAIKFLWCSFRQRLTKLQTLQNKIELIHKTQVDKNHYYLSLLAADPDFKGQGYVSRHLKSIFRDLDQKKIPTYLETMNSENVALYQHFGYQIVGEVEAKEFNLHTWAMLRKSQ